MRRSRVLGFVLSVTLLSAGITLHAQSWEFAKEKNGVRLYTCKEAGKSLKSYRGVADIHAPADKIFTMIEDVNHTDWWDKNLNEIKVLKYEKNKSARYYLVYDLPWPVTDRDLCVDVKVDYNPATGDGRITALPLPGLLPEVPGKIRIQEYRQTWTVMATNKDVTHVMLEGFVDPAGDIPDWLCNMLIVDSPFKVISAVKDRMEKK